MKKNIFLFAKPEPGDLSIINNLQIEDQLPQFGKVIVSNEEEALAFAELLSPETKNRLVFSNASKTMLRDICQNIEKDAVLVVYDKEIIKLTAAHLSGNPDTHSEELNFGNGLIIHLPNGDYDRISLHKKALT